MNLEFCHHERCYDDQGWMRLKAWYWDNDRAKYVWFWED